MKFGATDITNIKLGTVDIAKAMFGADEVWSAAPPALSYADWLKSLGPVEFFRMADAGTTMAGEMGAITGTHGASATVAAPIPTAAGAHSYDGAHHSTLISTAALEAAEFTTAMWLQFPSESPVGRSILNAFNGAFSHGHQLWFGNAGQQRVAVYSGNGSGTSSFAYATNLAPNTPHRVVVTHAAGTTRLYVNGTEVGSEAISYAPCPAGETWEFASEDGGAFFQGLIWDAAFFDYAWDAATVEEDYERGTEGLE